MRRRSVLLTSLAMVMALAACASSGHGSMESTQLPTSIAPTTLPPTSVSGRLVQAYPDPTVDPSADAWMALLDDDSLSDVAVSVIEFANVVDDSARDRYTTFIEAVGFAAAARGGELVAITDVWRAGLELPQGFDGGMVWAATFPTRDGFVATMLDETVVAAAAGRRAAVVDPHMVLGVNLVPESILDLPIPGDVEALPHDLVRGRPTAEVVDELLSLYPDGGADPPRDVLEAMLGRPDVRTQAVTYVNLYRFDESDTGASAITDYNAAALPFVLAHGARPRLVFDVAHQLLGTSTWNRAILVRWPSLEVFTDLRLTPGYVEAQVSRVTSSSAYGNLVTIDRADRD